MLGRVAWYVSVIYVMLTFFSFFLVHVEEFRLLDMMMGHCFDQMVIQIPTGLTGWEHASHPPCLPLPFR